MWQRSPPGRASCDHSRAAWCCDCEAKDEANELLRILPLNHPARQRALTEALQLPGRPGYVYFGRCASLPYVVEAAGKRAEAQQTEKKQEKRTDSSATRPVPCAMALAIRRAFGHLAAPAVRRATVQLTAAQEARRVTREKRAAAAAVEAAERRALFVAGVAKRPRTSSPTAARSSLGAQDPLAYLSDDSECSQSAD
eukprot:gnl/TRDRNA2_/TRDRNA2_38890_c0_seq2.p1 gnl/TRDRNA2_/TRDRNA2_38890_c0~~gnl/TRDRNA2_/TRDRNA2_38890_c0_seq2.p1  ORF type:complete len:197 (+),score=32.97 gnl/TRDRNA2_/TRDRNA2_38890_c0_seq2:171-761(+)